MALSFKRIGLFLALAGGLGWLLWLGTGAATSRPAAVPFVALEPFVSDLDQPVHVVGSGVAGDGRLFVVQQRGKIRVVNPNGTLRAAPFLDISERVDQTTGRTGLFGLAFHPNYAANGTFFVYYLQRAGDVFTARLSRFRVTADPNVADPTSENILLAVTKDHAGHNAGDLLFGPDGYLYWPLGDGDSRVIGPRPQDPTTVLGKIVRINVDDLPSEGAADCKGSGSGDYSIPPSNPLAGSPAACDEIWAFGLRNPWRLSFDRQTGGLYLTDVGEDAWDELNYAAPGAGGGRNYGWPCYEGDAVFEAAQWPARGCDAATPFTLPILTQAIHVNNDCSIIGGYVYRGTRYPALIGRYFMTDYCSGNLRSLTREGGEWVVTLHDALAPFGAVSFGQGNDGELYVVNLLGNEILHLVGDEEAATATPTATTPPGATATPTTTPTTTPDPTGTVTVTATVAPTATPVWSHRGYLPAALGSPADEPPPMPAAGRGGPTGHQGGRR
ncbi:conserved exported protein of unknown function [Candidatus Promineifilum breve]|uniref:Glucose/Sorbosone dehydrogenase domain-containing protein n=1 Tax=Candidatus Promineifilum breve TaxID=1806508 RepID=A0A170PJM9_9CHLR|nr:PQQ-dependent sugar dehydrogenase [Candidatus Promineifilum breve]CUS05743.1 conserved exported protein of unknown function [Candidatus Promineifilum breve]